MCCATLGNLTIEADITTTGWAGILASYASGYTIVNVTVKGSVKGSSDYPSVAGLCEYLYHSTVIDCTNEATVNSIFTYHGYTEAYDICQYAGGIACEVNGSVIKDCVNNGSVTAKSTIDKHVGGCLRIDDKLVFILHISLSSYQRILCPQWVLRRRLCRQATGL